MVRAGLGAPLWGLSIIRSHWRHFRFVQQSRKDSGGCLEALLRYYLKGSCSNHWGLYICMVEI